ncbi:MAG: class I SAM-dependent methyltransferase [Anaerolineae bacterium]|nr:N-6 DNA methylase [Anaerolineales bacterium]MCQ3978254.1 class I SAM-dependent methyltransferase [Anaerolineae bacterium]
MPAMAQLSFFKHLDTSFPTNKQTADSRKLRGGYYTPLELACFLIKWGLRDDTMRILEPSCGDGNFIMALLQRLHDPAFPKSLLPTIVAVELDPTELGKARARAEQFSKNGAALEWISQDFFAAYPYLQQNDKFNLIVGNPPFIRFQYFDDDSRNQAFGYLKQAGYKPTKLANAWVAFAQLSIELLQEGGRLAMVVPAELLQVKYAHELRDRLATQFEHIVIVGFKHLVFPEIQQEVVLLLAEGKREKNHLTSDIHTIEFLDGEELLHLDSLTDAVSHVPAKHSRAGMKWTSLFLDEAAFAALDEAETAVGLTPLGQLAEVDVGIVTGRNSFFILTEAQKEEFQVESLTAPIIGRTAALKTTNFNQEDFCHYKKQYPSFLLDLNSVAFEALPQAVKNYLNFGEQENIHRGYKCRIRRRWFDVPSIYVPDAFLFRQIHRYPLLVVNKAQVASTDTIHRVRVKSGITPDLLAATFFNSLTLAWAEVCGRSYGGGVLELEPGEAEELPIPYHHSIEIDPVKVEDLLRRNCVYEALDYVDGIVLKDYLGFDKVMTQRIRSAWEQLRDRRVERR